MKIISNSKLHRLAFSKILFCILILSTNTRLYSQFSCVFSSSTGTTPYSTIINQPGNGTFSWSPANIWDNATGQIFLLTPFKFNGVVVTTCNYSANGYIWFGTGSNPANNTTAENVLGLPSIGANNTGVIAAFARDLGEHPSINSAPVPSSGGSGRRLIQYTVLGTQPNRCTVIEFAGFYPKLSGSGCTGGNLGDNHRVDFQIKLYENNVAGLHPNRIELIYRNQSLFCNDSPYSFQAGIRGVDPTDFMCRTQNGGNMTSTSTSAGTANTDQIVFNGGDHVAQSGTSFIFDQTGISLSVTPASASICNGGSTTLSVNGANNFTWSPATGLSSTTGATVTASPTTTTTYTVTGSGGGCTATQTVTVTVTPGLGISVSPASASICSGSSTVLSATGATSYAWSPSTGLSATSGANVTANPTSSTTYTVAGSSGSCSGTQTVSVTVTPPIAVAVTPASADICIGGSTNLVASGATNYSWSPSTGLSATTGASVTANPSTTTVYTVNGTTGTCSGTQTITVNVGSTPTITISPALATICSGSSTTLTANGATTYSWSPSTGLSSITGATVTANPATTTTYTVTGSSGTCVGTQTVVVTVNEASTFSLIQDPANFNNLCNGPIDLSVPAGYTNVSWSNSASTNAISVTTPGVYTASARNPAGCIVSSNQVTFNQTVPPQVSITPTGSPSLCNGPVVLTATSGMTSYSWSNGQTTPTISVSQAGDFSVLCYDSQGCAGESPTTTVTGGDLPQVTISAPANTICPGETIVLTADPGFSSYSWNTGQTTQSITVNQAGSYSVTVQSNGCTGSSPAFAIQSGLIPISDFTYSQTTGYLINFENTSSNATQFLWDFGNGNTSTEENPDFTFPFDGTYPVKLIAQNGCGIDTLLINVVVLKLGLNELKGVELTLAPNPFPDQLYVELNLNAPAKLTMTIHSILGQLIYSEEFNGDKTFLRTIDFSNLSGGIYTVQLTSQEGILVRKVIKE
jgi:hypothetical protein